VYCKKHENVGLHNVGFKYNIYNTLSNPRQSFTLHEVEKSSLLTLAMSGDRSPSGSVRITKMLMGAAFASGESEKKIRPPLGAGKVKSQLLGCDCKDHV